MRRALALLALIPAALAALAARQPAPDVVFVCEHGNVKSLMAASFFNRLAASRGLPFRAAARGLHPESSVPAPIAEALRGDGFDVAGFRPLPLAGTDLRDVARTVTIGAALPPGPRPTATTFEAWDDVPPASVDYPAARAALLRHLEALLDELRRGSAKVR